MSKLRARALEFNDSGSRLASAIFAIVLVSTILGLSSAYGGAHIVGRSILGFSLLATLYTLFRAISVNGDRVFCVSFCLYMIFILIIPGIMQSAGDTFPFFRKSYPDGDVTAASVIVFIFTIFTIIAYLRTINSYKTEPSSPPSARRFAPIRALILWTAYTVVALFGLSYAGLSFYTTRRGEMVGILSPLANFVTNSARYSSFFSLILAMLLLINSNKSKIFAVPFVLTSSLLFYILNNPVNIPRTLTFAYVICAAFTLTPMYIPRLKQMFCFAYAVGIFGLLPLVNQISRGQRGGRSFRSLTETLTGTGDMDSFQSMINVWSWIKSVGPAWGHQLISALLIFVPRSVWSGKAVATGAAAAANSGYAYVNVSAPLPAEFFADFSWAGLLFLSPLFGYTLARLDQAATDARGSGSKAKLIFLGTAAGFLGIILRGSLVGVIGFVALAVILAWVTQVVEVSPQRTVGASTRGSRRR